MRRNLHIALLIVLGTVAYGANVISTLTPREATIGDRLEFTIRVAEAGGKPVQYPLLDGAEFMLLDVDSSDLAARGAMRFGYAVYDTGRHEFPELAVVVGIGAEAETLYTSPHSVFIESVLPDTAGSILPNKGLRSHPFRLADEIREKGPWIALALGLAALLAGFIWWIRKRRRPASEATAPPEITIPPHELAIKELVSLRDRKYPSRGMLKEFFSEYSEILRRYLEGRYEFPALEMTTFDLEYEFESERFPSILRERFVPSLRESDLVKFAKFLPDPAHCDEYLELGFEIVAATRDTITNVPGRVAA